MTLQMSANCASSATDLIVCKAKSTTPFLLSLIIVIQVLHIVCISHLLKNKGASQGLLVPPLLKGLESLRSVRSIRIIRTYISLILALRVIQICSRAERACRGASRGGFPKRKLRLGLWRHCYVVEAWQRVDLRRRGVMIKIKRFYTEKFSVGVALLNQ